MNKLPSEIENLQQENTLLKNKIENIIQFISEGYLLGKLIDNGKEKDIKILNTNKKLAESFHVVSKKIDNTKLSAIFPEKKETLIKKMYDAVKKNMHFSAQEAFVSLNKYFAINTFNVDSTTFVAFFEDVTEIRKNKLEVINTNIQKAKYKDELFAQYKLLEELNKKLHEKVQELNNKNGEISDANKKLKESELKIKMAIEAANSGIWEWNLTNNKLNFDKMAIKLLNIPKELQKDLPYEIFIDHIHPDDRSHLLDATQKYLSNKTDSFRVTYRIRPYHSNSDNWYSFLSYGKNSTPGTKDKKMIGTYIDITHQEKAKEEVLQTRKFLELILQNTPSGIFTVNKEKKVTNWNKRAEEILGYEAEEIIGKECKAFASKKCEELCDLMDSEIKKPIMNKECIIKTKHGQIKYLKKNINEIKDNNGNVIGGVESFEDITEIKNLEKKVLQAIIETEEKERRHISKELHDGLGSMISSIKIHVNMLQSKKISEKKKDEIIAKTNTIINETSQNIRDIANHLRPSVLSDFGLIEAIESFCNKINNANVVHIIFSTNFSNKLALKQSYEINIFRIIQELINNTIKHAQADKISINLNHSDGIANLLYKDNGIGIQHNITDNSLMDGHGLKNIMSRSKSIGADYVIGNNGDKGMFAEIIYKINATKN
jgi:PAS domain S-box-containing protein